MNPSTTIAVSVRRPPADIAAFVADARNLPRWAPAFCKSVRPLHPASEGNADDRWLVQTTEGELPFRFVVTGGAHGVLDHVVTLPTLELYVPLRVVPNEDGSEVLFTLFRLPDMTDERFQQDLKMVQADLEGLKRLLEGAL